MDIMIESALFSIEKMHFFYLIYQNASHNRTFCVVSASSVALIITRSKVIKEYCEFNCNEYALTRGFSRRRSVVWQFMQIIMNDENVTSARGSR